jgi:hypothetical protein
MYKVSSTLTNAYGSDIMEPKGIRSNKDLPAASVGGDLGSQFAPNPQLMPPLRYTPGLNCDPHLESLRPERNSKHPPIQGNDQWRKKLCPVPNTYDGSFADADIQAFRPPGSAPNPLDDTWLTSRLPEGQSPGIDRLAMPMGTAIDANPYGQMYPQDELSRIKMRNRRFMNAAGGSCAQEYMSAPMMMMGPPPQQQMMMMGGWGAPPPQPPSTMDELAFMNAELNATRRRTGPSLPVGSPDYYDVQRQATLLEQPMQFVKPTNSMPLSVADLPEPKKVRAPLTEELMAANPSIKSSHRNMNIAEQIAIRSFVLSKDIKSAKE